MPDPAVQAYYDETYVDYRMMWSNRDNYAMHFGYFTDGVRSHADALNNANLMLSGFAEIERGHRVLDAGSGVGGTARWLATHCGAEVVGITPVPGQVEKAREITVRNGVTGATFEVGDYTSTSFPDASFDSAIALESLCHAEDKAAFYSEMFRILKPGGRLVIAEYTRVGRDLAPRHEAMMRSWLDGWAIPDIGTVEEHLEWARRAGFDDVTHRDGSHLTRRSLRRLYLLSIPARPVDLVLHRLLGLRSAVQSGNVRASRDQWRTFRDGFWIYSHFIARRS